MQVSWKLIIILLIVAAAAGIFYKLESGKVPSEVKDSEQQEIPAPPATGKINETVEAILGFSDSAEPLYASEDEEISLVQLDKDALGGYLEIYDENSY